MVVVEKKEYFISKVPPASIIKPYNYLGRGSQYFFRNEIQYHTKHWDVTSLYYQSTSARGVVYRKGDELRAWWEDP